MLRKNIRVASVLFILAGVSVLIVCRYTPLGTALLWKAASSGNVTATRALILFGVNINVRDSNSGTPIFAAAGHAHPQVVSILLKAGADPLVLDDRGQTALCYSLQSASGESLQCDELLIKAGCLQKQRNPLGCVWSSMTAAAHVALLLEHGVDPNGSNGTPLRTFAYNGDVAAMSILLEHGADPNAVAQDGRTALSEAVVQGNPEAVEFLINHGAHATIRVDSHSPLDIARSKRDEYAKWGAVSAVPRYDAIVHLLEARASK